MDPQQIPPPPYSETDSNASPNSNLILTPATSHSDGLSLPAPSVESPTDDSVIYTPPYTPTGSVHQSISGDHDQIASSAAAYIDSRPVLTIPSGPPIIHSIRVTSTTNPHDLPYPEPEQDWLSKDVTHQDWATFVNHLLPGHSASTNNDVADRKLKAELIDERMHRLTLGQDDSSRIDLGQVDAQLNPLRQPSWPSSEHSNKVDATVAFWNEHFFSLRGLHMRLIDSELQTGDETNRMPGAWTPDDDGLADEPSANSREPRRSWGFGVNTSSRGFRIGPIVANNEGFRIGRNGVVADEKGFRIGDMLEASHRGFRLGGHRFVADDHGLTIGRRTWGRKDLHDRENNCGRDRGRGGGRHRRGRSHSHHRHGRRRGRSSSTSSTSSSSSSSSSDSDSSVGSLPDYDDLRDQQLPIAKRSLIQWLNDQERPITKESLQIIKQDIRTAQSGGARQFEHNQDIRALRREVKDLMKRFKDKKKAEKALRKDRRKARHAHKKAHKKERRNAKKELQARLKGKCRENPRDVNPAMASQYVSPPASLPPGAAGLASPATENLAMPSLSRMGRGVPSRRAAPGPFMESPSLGRTHHGPPGLSAMHGGWPFSQGISVLHGNQAAQGFRGFPFSVSHGAEQLHEQALNMDEEAVLKETMAIDARAAATGRQVGEKERLKKLDQASTLEEEAENYRREAGRLRAEASQLDEELAREMDEHGDGQTSGVISY